MSKATSGSSAPDDKEAPKEAKNYAYSLPRDEFLRLDDAINFALLRLRPDRRGASGVFEQKRSIARAGAILFGVEAAEQEQALIFAFEKKLSDAARAGDVRFKGVKAPSETDDHDAESPGATGLEWVPSSAFMETRGFDAERCRITITSYNISGPDLEDAFEWRSRGQGSYVDWTNVVVESKSYRKWLGREYPTILGGSPKLGKEGLRILLEAEKQKRGEALSQAEAFKLVRAKGYSDSRALIREVANLVAQGRGPGRPRKISGSQA